MIAGALQVIKDFDKDKRVVILLVDGVRNYITKFLNDDWMLENGFYTQEEYNKATESKYIKKSYYGEDKLVGDLKIPTVKSFGLADAIKDVLAELVTSKVDACPIVDNDKVVGLISLRQISNVLTGFKYTKNDEVRGAIIKDFKVLSTKDPLNYLSKAFNRHQFVIVTNDDGSYGIAQAKDLMDLFLSE